MPWIKAIDLKLFSPYGPRDNEKLIIFLIKSILKNKEVEISKGEQLLSWTYVRDIVDAYVKAVEYVQKMDKNYESFNIGNGEAVSIKKIVEILKEISGKNLIKCNKDYGKNEIMYAKCNNDKARRVLGWNPLYFIRQGLKETYDYYKNGI